MTKNPTTFKEQMNLLKSRNIIIDNEDMCLDYLSSLNYYRLSGYLLPFKIKNDEYIPTTFYKICSIYEFDRRLRILLLEALEELELYLRTKLAYNHSHKYGALGYLEEKNFSSRHNHKKFIDSINKAIDKNKKTIFIKHHIESKDNNLPLWVLIEILSFGSLSLLFSDLKEKDQKAIDNIGFKVGYEQLASWLHCLTMLRNRCAHYARLYYHNFDKTPKNDLNKTKIGNTLFGYIYILKQCYPDKKKWNTKFLETMVTLLKHYEDYIHLEHIGFPLNWEASLKN
ncbi:MAG: Abi family protein [Defluviitaleaceae bacterium]|nr:Abi family protein [Defluviitaleaceae bacterium]